MGNLQVRFLEGWAPAMAPGHSTIKCLFCCNHAVCKRPVIPTSAWPCPSRFALSPSIPSGTSNVKSKFARVFTTRQTSVFFVSNLAAVQVLPHTKRQQRSSEERDRRCSRAQKQGDEDMLGTLAAVLIVLWLLGFFAFHVTTAFVHVALIVGLILLVMHFMRRSTASV